MSIFARIKYSLFIPEQITVPMSFILQQSISLTPQGINLGMLVFHQLNFIGQHIPFSDIRFKVIIAYGFNNASEALCNG